MNKKCPNCSKKVEGSLTETKVDNKVHGDIVYTFSCEHCSVSYSNTDKEGLSFLWS